MFSERYVCSRKGRGRGRGRGSGRGKEGRMRREGEAEWGTKNKVIIPLFK